MKKERILAFVLVSSLALNLFLSGFVLRTWNHSFGQSKHPASESRRPPSDARPGTKRNDQRRRNLARGSEDLILLRRMVKAMGGREDPRVTSLRAEHREGLKGVRRDIEKARADVRAALLQEPFEEHALRLALSELRKHSNKAQKRAQDDMVHLALRMTPAERNELRKLPPLPKRKPRPKKD